MLTHPSFQGLARIAHGFFTREGGTSEGIYASLNCGPGSNDTPSHVAENRRRTMDRLGLPRDGLVTASQVHGTHVHFVTGPFNPARPIEADGLVTKTTGLAIGILTADCAPVLLADPDRGIVGAAHAGWRGAKTGVLEAVLAEMVGQGARLAHIQAVIGPCIGQQSYEVAPGFPDPFLAEDPDNARFFQGTPAGRFRFDLGAYVEARLRGAGVIKPTRIDADTYCEPARFFSYRRATHKGEPDYGRVLSAIAIQNGA
ncbi:MAG: polyphenol oxidase [Rhodospirillaceae bacterium]|nr:MAG: polyphenol oxidase [Rhodospirillaceae bacterium]